MKKIIIPGLFLILFSIHSSGQNGRVVLVEEFSETGCGACAEYDSAFQALTARMADKIAVINYHCNYMLDTFYQYNKVCDKRNAIYHIGSFPSALANGTPPEKSTAHMIYVNEGVINRLYAQSPLFKFEVTSTSLGKENNHSALLNIKTTALEKYNGKELRLFVVATENNINHLERYRAKAINGVNEFNHIARAFLTGPEGKLIGAQKKGAVNKLKITYTNDDKEINYKEVRIVVFMQDLTTNEVLGAYVMKENPFK